MSYKTDIKETSTEISLFGKITINKSSGFVTISTNAFLDSLDVDGDSTLQLVSASSGFVGKVLNKPRQSNKITSPRAITSADTGFILESDTVTAIDLTFNTNSLTSIDDVVHIEQINIGAANIIAGSGVTIQSEIGGSLSTNGQYTRLTIQKVGATSYRIVSEVKKIPKFKFVRRLLDLPNAISNVITLEADVTYFITDTIDLLGARLVGSANTTIIGGSSENSILTSTGLGVGVPLLSSIYTTPIRNIAINDVDTAFNFDGATNPNDMALDWTGVNFLNVPNIGLIKDASNFIFDKGAFLNSKGLRFDGTIGTVGFGNSLFTGDGSVGNIITIEPTCIITRRFRIIYSSVVAFGSTVGLNVSESATIPVQAYILDTVNFSGGSTYISGVGVTDNKTLFINCIGVKNTREISQYYMSGNATPTVVSSVSTLYKVLGTTISAPLTQKFINTNNRATYIGALANLFKITATISLLSGNTNQISVYVAKNGIVIPESEVSGTASGTGKSENIVVQSLVELEQNDYIEIFVENDTSVTDITVTELNVIIQD